MQGLGPPALRLGLFLGSGFYNKALATWGRDLTKTTTGPLSDKSFSDSWQSVDERRKLEETDEERSINRNLEENEMCYKSIIEERWEQFFADPSKWWDHRWGKINAKYPDFTHKTTRAALWVDKHINPQWVEGELAAMTPGTVQCNIFSWNQKLVEYVKDGKGDKALELFHELQQKGLNPNISTFIAVLDAVSSLGLIAEGRLIHAQIMETGWDSNLMVATSLVRMYATCGSIEDARRVFDKMPTRDVVSWNAMISGYLRCGQGQKALELFQEMQGDGLRPDPITFVGIVNACADTGKLDEGRQVHAQITNLGYGSHAKVGSSLVNMYAKCGSIGDAVSTFMEMPVRGVVAWTAMITAYVKNGQGQKALEAFQQMQKEGVEPDLVTFVVVLNACASVGALDEGVRVHLEVIQRGYYSDVKVGCSLVDMYTKCGSLEDARRVFNEMCTCNVVAWNAMIMGYAKCENGQEALELYWQMQAKGVKSNCVTFLGVLNACGNAGALEEGRRVHAQITETGFESDMFLMTTLVDMYAKCGSIDDAWNVFSKMPVRTTVAWNTIILGYVKCGLGQKALGSFQQMQVEGVKQDPVTFVGALNACASIAALEEGRRIHANVIRNAYEGDGFVRTALIDMYGKCGSLQDAQRVFDKTNARSVSSWNAIVGGYATHGHAFEALELIEQMCQAGVEMNRVTFICLLSACCHAGLVDEGLHFFGSMGSVHGFSATVEHYVCMVDLLGRAGRLSEAEDMIGAMACEPNSTVWIALLGACRVHGNVEMGERIATQVLELDPQDASAYVLLSNIYGATGNWVLREYFQRTRKGVLQNSLRAPGVRSMIKSIYSNK